MVSKEDLDAINKTSVAVPDGSGYLATLDVFHQVSDSRKLSLQRPHVPYATEGPSRLLILLTNLVYAFLTPFSAALHQTDTAIL